VADSCYASLGLKGLEHEADHSPPLLVRLRMCEAAIPPLPQCVFMG